MMRYTILALISVASATCAWAQTPPAADETAPRAASSPHQRDTTSTKANEAETPTESEPAASSTPHQKQTTQASTAKTKAERDQMMKDCVTREQAKNSEMTKDQVKKRCMEQMKTSTDHPGGG
jgi:hypothetical protein